MIASKNVLYTYIHVYVYNLCNNDAMTSRITLLRSSKVGHLDDESAPHRDPY